MKFNVSMNDELFEKLEAEAKKMYTSRSGLVSLAVTKYLNEQNMMQTLGQFPDIMKKLEDMKNDAK